MFQTLFLRMFIRTVNGWPPGNMADHLSYLRILNSKVRTVRKNKLMYYQLLLIYIYFHVLLFFSFLYLLIYCICRVC